MVALVTSAAVQVADALLLVSRLVSDREARLHLTAQGQPLHAPNQGTPYRRGAACHQSMAAPFTPSL